MENPRGHRYPVAFRLAVVSEAVRFGVAATCRKFGISRTTCYAWKNRWDPAVPLSLADPPQVKTGHPPTTPPEIVRSILAVSAENPSWGCKRLAVYVTMLGTPVSSPTVQKLLIKAGLGRAWQRMAARQRRIAARPTKGRHTKDQASQPPPSAR